MSIQARPARESWRVICPSDSLVEGGEGVRFEWRDSGQVVPAFLVRIDGVPRAWLNRCAHQSVELDWIPGRFFASDRRHLVCSLHGAVYDARSGVCVDGPCEGQALIQIASRDRAGWAEVREDFPSCMQPGRNGMALR